MAWLSHSIKQIWQTLMAKPKRKKAEKGFDQLKKNNGQGNLPVNPTANAVLEKIANQMGISPPEVVEQMAQGKLALTSPTPEVTVAITPEQTQTTPTVELLSNASPASNEWEQQLAQKDAEINQLKHQLAQQEDLQQQYQTTSLQHQQQSIYISELEDTRSQQQQHIDQLTQQLRELQQELATQKRHHQAELAAKQAAIDQLNQQIQTLQAVASVGEQQLNRWRPYSVK